VLTSPWTTCSTCHLDLLPQSRVPEASGAGGERKAFFQTGAHAPGVCHHCCRRIPRDHARNRAPGTTVLTAFDNPIPLSLPYVKGGGGASYFPVSAITDRLYARNQLVRRARAGVVLWYSTLQAGGTCFRPHGPCSRATRHAGMLRRCATSVRVGRKPWTCAAARLSLSLPMGVTGGRAVVGGTAPPPQRGAPSRGVGDE